MTHRGNWCVVLLGCCSAVINLHLSFLLPYAVFSILQLLPSPLIFLPPLLLIFFPPSICPPSLSVVLSLTTFNQVSECNWPSRQAPSLHNLFAVCKNMHNWLKQNPKNVCVITCSVRRHSHTSYSSPSREFPALVFIDLVCSDQFEQSKVPKTQIWI